MLVFGPPAQSQEFSMVNGVGKAATVEWKDVTAGEVTQEDTPDFLLRLCSQTKSIRNNMRCLILIVVPWMTGRLNNRRPSISVKRIASLCRLHAFVCLRMPEYDACGHNNI